MAVSLAPSPDIIRTLNDRLRQRHKGGAVVVTAGMHALGPAMVAKVVAAVGSYNAFAPDNDPYGEHDFGVVEVEGQQAFFKIDAFDLDHACMSPEPSDPAVTRRVLTIMLAEEY